MHKRIIDKTLATLEEYEVFEVDDLADLESLPSFDVCFPPALVTASKVRGALVRRAASAVAGGATIALTPTTPECNAKAVGSPVASGRSPAPVSVAFEAEGEGAASVAAAATIAAAVCVQRVARGHASRLRACSASGNGKGDATGGRLDGPQSSKTGGATYDTAAPLTLAAGPPAPTVNEYFGNDTAAAICIQAAARCQLARRPLLHAQYTAAWLQRVARGRAARCRAAARRQAAVLIQAVARRCLVAYVVEKAHNAEFEACDSAEALLALLDRGMVKLEREAAEAQVAATWQQAEERRAQARAKRSRQRKRQRQRANAASGDVGDDVTGGRLDGPQGGKTGGAISDTVAPLTLAAGPPAPTVSAGSDTIDFQAVGVCLPCGTARNPPWPHAGHRFTGCVSSPMVRRRVLTRWVLLVASWVPLVVPREERRRLRRENPHRSETGFYGGHAKLTDLVDSWWRHDYGRQYCEASGVDEAVAWRQWINSERITHCGVVSFMRAWPGSPEGQANDEEECDSMYGAHEAMYEGAGLACFLKGTMDHFYYGSSSDDEAHSVGRAAAGGGD